MSKVDLVFVHLGSKIPNHLISNLNYCCAIFPQRDIVLITNTDFKQARVNSRVKIWKYSPSEEVMLKIANEFTLNPRFRNGFWIYTKLRFIALSNYVTELKKSILHIESDVWIAPYFNFTYFETLEQELAFPLVDPKRAVASVLFIKGDYGAKMLKQATLISKDSTDMQILNKIRNVYTHKVLTLPSTYSAERAFNVYSDKNSVLFDGIAIGMYLFGDDSRGTFGISRRFTDYPNTNLHLSRLEFRLIEGILELRIDSSWRNVQSLHLHSKTEVLFSPHYAERLSQAIRLSKGGPRKEFHFWGFVRCLMDYSRLLIWKMFFK